MPDLEYIKRLREQRVNIREQQKALYDRALAAKRDLTADELQTDERFNEQLDTIAERVKGLEEAEQRAKDTEAAFDKLLAQPAQRGEGLPSEGGTDPAIDMRFRDAILRNDLQPIKINWTGRSGYQPGIERRSLLTTSGGGMTPTSFWDALQRHMVEGSAILSAGATLITTDTGETLKVPKSTALSTAAIVAEGAAISSSDPTLGSAPLGAYKYGFLVQISRELAQDSSFDVAGYLAAQAGEALANGAGAHFMTGTGTGQPTGAITAASTGVTGGTGVAGAFTADNLIDLYHSVAEPYARAASAGWMMRTGTLGAVRKLKDTTNRYLFDVEAPAGSGASGTLLGRPVFADPNVAAVGLSAKSVAFGDFSRYWVRSVSELVFERSDHYAFNTDLVTFRALWRTDGTLVDTTGAIKVFVGGAT